MDYITLTELLGVRAKRIQSGSELLFIWELYKYCRTYLNKILTIEDAQVLKAVREGEHFSYVYNNSEINLNYVPKEGEVLADYSETGRKYFNGDLQGVVFEKQDDFEWVYCYNTDKRANIVLNGYNRSAGYVSLYAYMLVMAYKEGKKAPILRLVNLSHQQEEQEYVDILILQNCGNKWLEGKVIIEHSKEVVVQPEWEAYIMYNRQLGNMLKEATLLEKRRYAKRVFKVGDVILYYQTDKSIKSKTIRKLTSCYPAVIKKITDEGIEIEYYPLIETALTHRRRLEEVERTCDIEDFKYSHADYENFPRCKVTLEYISTGVDILTYTEDSFILQLTEGVDTFEQYIVDKEGIESIHTMGAIETIYAVFEDRQVDYDKKSYKDKHFKRIKPIYDQILGQ